MKDYFIFGEMAERSNAAVLKTVDCNRSGGSNPSLSANKGVNQQLMRFAPFITPKKFLGILVWFIAARCQGFYSYVSFRATRIRLSSTTILLLLVVTKPHTNESDFRVHPRVWTPRLAGRSGSSRQPNAFQRVAPAHQSRASLVSNALCPFFNRSNNPSLILAIQSAGVSRGRNGFRKDKSGEKLAESEEDLLEHRTDGSDAFDTLYIGCKKLPVHDIVSVPVSGVM